MPKRRSLACPKCGRLFTMAAHLGRHLATIHAGSRTAAASSLPTATAGRSSGAGQPSLLAQSTGDPVGSMLTSLRATRDEAAAQLAQLGAQLTAIEAVLTTFWGQPLDGRSSRQPAASPPRSTNRGRAKRGTVISGILKALGERGPLKPALVAATTGAKPTTVSVALDTLQKKKLAKRSAAGWVITAAGKADLARRQRMLPKSSPAGSI